MQRHPIPPRASRPAPQTNVPQAAEEDEYDDVWPPRLPTSTRAYVNRSGDQVYEQGNRRMVFHKKPPPKRVHWMVVWSLGILFAIGVLYVGSHIVAWWNEHQLDATYGMPRTWQTNAVVGDGDSTAHSTHFIFLNLDGRVEIIELPPDTSRSRIYSGPTLYTDNADQTPVTADFQDVKGDGHVDMIVHIGDQNILYLNDGTGYFKPQQ